jgi:hypothetical protein
LQINKAAQIPENVLQAAHREQKTAEKKMAEPAEGINLENNNHGESIANRPRNNNNANNANQQQPVRYFTLTY